MKNVITLALTAGLLAGCGQTTLLRPNEVTPNIGNVANICDTDNKSLLATAAPFLIEQAAKLFVKEISNQLKEEIKKKVSIYQGAETFSCNIRDGVANNTIAFTFTAKDDDKPNPVRIPVSLSTDDNYTYMLTFDPRKVKHNWAHLSGNTKFDGSVLLTIKWVTYARDGETTLQQVVFNDTVAALKIRDGKLKDAAKAKPRTLTGLRPAKSQPDSSLYEQRHVITWSMTLLDESLSAQALRKLHETLDSKKDKLTSEVEDELKDIFDVKD
ncbi:hypothetical protein NF212_21605 [Parasalinivibrio latis]|uniref:hypothetical protein n=1 Tax=Parasalinivibrio latis TaxID=2952610 RepID=UPI0030E39848